jgi:outer membrane protein OmpA-like peptidoglycan-associated protein
MWAQNFNKITADQHFNRLEYTYAIQDYLVQIKEGNGSERVYERLAISYKKLANYRDAERYYRRLAKGKNGNPKYLYDWAQMLKANGKYEEYSQQMLRFVDAMPTDPRAISYTLDLETLQSIQTQEPLYTVNRVTFNSKRSDFGAVRYGDTLYYASAKAPMKKNHGWTDQSFLDIYKATISKDGKVGSGTPLSEMINTKYHEGISTITPDGKRIFFDRNNYTNGKYQKDSVGVNQLQLYYADRVNGAFAKAVPLPFNDTNYSTGHPALSPDGKTLYFASDRPGGQGMADIWKVVLHDDGSFGTPENAGSLINSPGKDAFPFIHPDGRLFFTSDGHVGLGGFDIFTTDGEIIINLGAPINTGTDDFSLKFNSDGTSGYMASNRKRKGDDDIYAFAKIPPCTGVITIMAKDTQRQPLSNATITIIDLADNSVQTQQTDTLGRYAFSSDCDKKYTVVIQAEGHDATTQTVEIRTKGITENFSLETSLDVEIVGDRVVLNPIYFDFSKWEITPQAALELNRLVTVMQRYPTMIISAESHTDARGKDSYNMTLSDKRATSMRDYVISQGIAPERISGIGKGETDPAVSCGMECTEEQHQLNRRSEFVIVKQ